MTFKFLLYFVITLTVVWAMDSVNINQIFKKNANPIQAKIMYFILVLSTSYLVTNFFFDLINSVKIL